jgi:hypothetical protein
MAGWSRLGASLGASPPSGSSAPAPAAAASIVNLIVHRAIRARSSRQGRHGQPPPRHCHCHGAAAAAAVSHSCACIGSPGLRHCVHGASIGGSLELRPASSRGGGPRGVTSGSPTGQRSRSAGSVRAASAQQQRASARLGGVASAAAAARRPKGESFMRVYWVAVPKALRARRVNKGPGVVARLTAEVRLPALTQNVVAPTPSPVPSGVSWIAHYICPIDSADTLLPS